MLGHIETECSSRSRMAAQLLAVNSYNGIPVDAVKTQPGLMSFRFFRLKESSIPHSSLIEPVFRTLRIPDTGHLQLFRTIKIIFHQFCLVVIETSVRKIYRPDRMQFQLITIVACLIWVGNYIPLAVKGYFIACTREQQQRKRCKNQIPQSHIL